MKFKTFIRDIFKKFPGLITVSTSAAVVASAIEACSLLTVGPLIDLLLYTDRSQMSPLTIKVIGIMEKFHWPVSLENYLIIFVAFMVLSSGLRIYTRYSIERSRYAVVRELLLGTYEDFFKARWNFFTSSRQGTLLNTFLRQVEIVGSAFD